MGHIYIVRDDSMMIFKPTLIVIWCENQDYGVICVKPGSQYRLWSDGSPSALTGEEPFRCGRTRIPGGDRALWLRW
jgi:hypothetical protein